MGFIGHTQLTADSHVETIGSIYMYDSVFCVSMYVARHMLQALACHMYIHNYTYLKMRELLN